MTSLSQIAVYCRVSTFEQKKNGLGMDIQIRDVTAFAKDRCLDIDRFYRDEAQSGVTENRRELRKLMRACERGEIHTVIIPTLDRLSRNVRIAEILFHQFEELGVRVYIADMPGYDSRNRRDVLIRQIREAIDEDNRKEIIERLWKARQERVRQGKAPGGNVAYGYRRQAKQWVADDEETKVVRAIFRMSDAGASASEIVTNLNGNGFFRRNRQPWIARQVNDILSRRNLYERGAINYGDVDGRNDNLILLERQRTESAGMEAGAAL